MEDERLNGFKSQSDYELVACVFLCAFDDMEWEEFSVSENEEYTKVTIDRYSRQFDSLDKLWERLKEDYNASHDEPIEDTQRNRWSILRTVLSSWAKVFREEYPKEPVSIQVPRNQYLS